MSCIQSAATVPHVCIHRAASVPAVGLDRRLRRALSARLWRTMVRWAARACQRRDLAELDAHLLKDIGVTPDQARREAAKPFWIG